MVAQGGGSTICNLRTMLEKVPEELGILELDEKD